MDISKKLRGQVRKLFNISGMTYRSFAEVSGIPATTINDYLSKEKNVSADSLLHILDSLGVNVMDVVDKKLKEVAGAEVQSPTNVDQDVIRLINNLEGNHRRELVRIAVNFNKIKKDKKWNDIIERVERQNH